MKTSLKTPLTHGCKAWFSLHKSFFSGKKFSVLVLSVFMIVGMSFAITATVGKYVPVDPVSVADTTMAAYEVPEHTNTTNYHATSKQAGEANVAPVADTTENKATITAAGNGALSDAATDPLPSVKIVANYCVVQGKVRLTATSSPTGATFNWSTGETGSVIDVDIANMYDVVAHFSNGDSAIASRKVAEELVINGDFSDGNTGFFSEYGYAADIPGNNSELVPEGLYGIGTSAHDYHGQFFGREHSTPGQTGNFMIINGSTVPIGSPARQRIIWQQSVTVQPNTNYYFSAQAMNVNPASPAELQFQVNGALVGTIADLDMAAKPSNDGMVNRSNWVRFYSNPTWNSGNNTTATIQIINLNTEASGNDFGLDDISFSTLSPFITLVSEKGTDAQTTCLNADITPIVYSVGSDASGHSITGLPPGITASFDVPNFLTFSGAPTAAGMYTYSITTTGTCNPVTVTGTINIPTIWNTWTGAVSNDWSNANNWACGTVPTAITNAQIPTGVSRMPMLTATSMCKLMDLQSSTVLNLNGQFFTNYGGITGTGKFLGSALSNLTIDAAGTSNKIYFDQSVPGASNALNSFTVTGANNSVLITNRLLIYGVLAPQNGTLSLIDTLVLRSTNKGTARVDQVTGVIAYARSGKVEVERYYPARRAWRLVTSPLAKANTIFDSWQNGGKYTAGKGTYVSGATATNPAGTNGLDWSPMNNASLKTGVTLAAVTNTHVSLSKNVADTSDNIPYFLFVRGDRDPANTNITLSNNTTLSSDGKLQTGRQTFAASAAQGGFTLVGNPYASPVDFSKLTLSNLKKHFLVWDPYLNTEQGGYVLVEETSPGVYDMIPRSPGGMTQVLQSSQAFFVETSTNGPASITFQETAKCGCAANPTAFRPIGVAPSIRTNLYHLNDNDSTLLLDGVMALFDTSFQKGVDGGDVPKSSNPKEMVALVRDNKTLTLERRPLLESGDTLFLRLTKTTQRKYRFEFEPGGLDPVLTASLEDSYSGTKTSLNVNSKSSFDFEINGDAASADVNRFRIVFKQAAPLPVTYKSISAKQQQESVAVKWTVENEINIKKYEVERSGDGIDFKKVTTTDATGANRSTVNYLWLDKSPMNGNNYYRVKSISPDGKSDFSKTVVVKIAHAVTGLQVTPNPSTGESIGITFKNMPAGMYDIKLVNALGQAMVTKHINHTAGVALEKLYPGKLVVGVYELIVTNPDQSMGSAKLIVQ